MVTIVIILSIIVVLLVVVQSVSAKRFNNRIGQLKTNIDVLRSLYDGLDNTVSEQYSDIGAIGNRIAAIESQLVKDSQKKETKSKTKSNKQ